MAGIMFSWCHWELRRIRATGLQILLQLRFHAATWKLHTLHFLFQTKPSGGASLVSARLAAEAFYACTSVGIRSKQKQAGVQVKNHCVGLRPAPPLAEAKVTQLATASFRDNLETSRCSFHTKTCAQPACAEHRPNSCRKWQHCRLVWYTALFCARNETEKYDESWRICRQGKSCLRNCHPNSWAHV